MAVSRNNVNNSDMEEIEKVEVYIDSDLLKELVVENVTFRSTCDFRVTEADLKKAREELKETDEARKSSLKNLREMLYNDKRHKYRMDDDYLLRFLRHRKFDCKRAYECIEYFYTKRNEDPELFRMPHDLEIKMKGKYTNLMPYLNEDGVLVFLKRLGHWDPAEMPLRDILKLFICGSDVTSMNPHAQINGAIDIWDLAGTTTAHVSSLVNPSTLRLWTNVLQNLYPWRIKKIIMFNCPAFFYTGFSIIRYFLKKKVSDRLVILRSDLSELHQYVNPAILPKEYGGCLDDDECSSYFKKVVLSNSNYLKYENSFIGCQKE